MAVQLTPQRKVLAIAASQIGYSRWSDKKTGTKYARETQPVFWPRDTWLLANGISYCDLFVTWVFWKALGKDFVTKGYLPAGASYNTDYRASKGGRVSKSEAAPGDVLVFDWNWATASTNHVGILEKRLSGDRFQTIEGNTSVGSSGSQSNGGRVARRIRKHSQVRYVLRPNWSKAGGTSGGSTSAPASKNVWDTSARIKGMSKTEVKSIQKLLVGAGYSVGKSGIDGSYKGDTVSAVKKAQKALGQTVDGVAGPDTVAALKKAQKGTSKPSTPSKPSTSKPKPSTPKAPTFPLPRKTGALYFYGIGKEKEAVTGKVRNTGVPKDVVQDKHGKWYSKGLKLWQARMKARGWKIAVDGRFGEESEKITKQFQKLIGEKVDGKIGPKTFVAAWEEPVQ